MLLSDLRPYPGNPHQHSNKQLTRLATTIKKRFINPIITDEIGMIFAGHGRYGPCAEMVPAADVER